MPWRAGWIPSSPGMKTESVLRSPALMISSAETEDHDPDLDQAEGDADARGDRDPAIGQVPDDARAEQRERHPQVVLRVAGQLGDE